MIIISWDNVEYEKYNKNADIFACLSEHYLNLAFYFYNTFYRSRTSNKLKKKVL